jgi:hypothetical protein
MDKKYGQAKVTLTFELYNMRGTLTYELLLLLIAH